MTQRITIMMLTPEGTTEPLIIGAMTQGALAVHQVWARVNASPVYTKHKIWIVTHVPSGHALGQSKATRADAVRWMESLLEAELEDTEGGWATITPKESQRASYMMVTAREILSDRLASVGAVS